MDENSLRKRGAKYLNPGTTVSPEVFALVKFLEAVVIGVSYTVDGEVYACKKDGKEFTLPLEIEELYPRTDELVDMYLKTAMGRIYALVEDIKKTGRRAVPPLREELLNRGVSKKEMSKLEKLGLISSRIIAMNNSKTKKPIGARACTHFTTQGRAYVRKYFNSAYGTERSDEWDAVRADPKWGEYLRRARMGQHGLRGEDGASEEVSAGLSTDSDQVSSGSSESVQ